MSLDPAIDVLVDTDVWSIVFGAPRRSDPRREPWMTMLQGRRVLISAQTRVEILVGAAALGPKRATALLEQLDLTPTLPMSADVQAAWVALTVEARDAGHALGAKQHVADRWVAATAIGNDIELLAGDGIYTDAPGLRLLTP